jgi:cyclopropane-fatty-acyl-phospholipid synthase
MALRAWKEKNSAQQSLVFLQALLREYHPRDFAVELWDGTRWEPEPNQFRRFDWKINRPGGLRAAFREPSQLALAEAYIYRHFDLEGDLAGVFPLADYLLSHEWSKKEKLRLMAMWVALPRTDDLHPLRPGTRLSGRLHSKDRDRQAVRYHYDVSNDFYSLWLGKEMAYSCAYFIKPEDDLNTAQEQKLDYICRKLRLKPGERLLDIGCGWGSLIIHAARNYGVEALGITLSEQQLALTKRRIVEAGLADRCEARLLDYREVESAAWYDKLVSIGMVEHVGEANLLQYFQRAYRLLRPGGVFLNHGIGVPENRPKPKGPNFVDLYVFPDGEFVPIGTMMRAAEQAGFEVRDVENLREHYALTCGHWVRGMEEHAEEARRLVDEVTYRIWRLQMAGSEYYFRRGWLDLYQTLLVKSEQGQSGLPLTRADWYAG